MNQGEPVGDKAAEPALLVLRDISKQFGGTKALSSVSFRLQSGEILALLGENGAGKSTLIKILAGVHSLDAGSITYRNQESSHAVRALPIAFIHQDLGLIEWMTVAENVSLTLGYPRCYGLIDWSAVNSRTSKALAAVGADIDPDSRVQNLTRAEKSLVAIARALAAEAEVLVLDEPTASLPADEVSRLFAVLRRLRERGMGIIYVSHRLDEIFEITDRMVVLRDGSVAGERLVANTTPEEVILLIVGREPSQVFRRPIERAGPVRLSVEGMTIGDVGPIDCEFRSGEIVGLVGLRGAGQESFGRALFGLLPIDQGHIELDGQPLKVQSPREAMQRGLALVCADRVGESVLPGMTIRENFFVNNVMAGLHPWSVVYPSREITQALTLGNEVGLRPNNPALSVELLSGGNQQKVVIGRWLNLGGKVYIFEDPTAGVDVGAKAEIYRLFDVALAAGSVIIIISTDFEEVAKVCHRTLVFNRGRVAAELGAAELSIKNLVAVASASVGYSGGAKPFLDHLEDRNAIA
ncbi:MAG TPA: sugar ABC transporter ATP-binding protein [Acidisoma sp.]|uniref:sugar ABC transporter ATP-binding protein n=1 Tax=Acidisoma sp. TaxID=1872115 RepID=UPI002CDD42B1|nr:sugar ABC transporter ATP-binding protein [Acidisoma sp.]HTI00867.1 sugar ABC transporter ATP-binding protein [Acidisoma sp.]